MSRLFTELIRERRSIRSFDSTPVEQDKIQRILENINLCPTAGNQQAFHTYVVTNKSKIEAVSKSCGQEWIAEAPLLFVFCCEAEKHFYGQRGLTLFTLQDAAIAQTYAVLACQNEGLKTCWAGGFDESAVSSILDIPSHWRPVGLLPCGYSNVEPRYPYSRKEIDEVFSFVNSVVC